MEYGARFTQHGGLENTKALAVLLSVRRSAADLQPETSIRAEHDGYRTWSRELIP